MKLFIKDFFNKCGQIRSKLRIWSQLLKKSLMENFIFCVVVSSAFRFCLYIKQQNNFCLFPEPHKLKLASICFGWWVNPELTQNIVKICFMIFKYCFFLSLYLSYAVYCHWQSYKSLELNRSRPTHCICDALRDLVPLVQS